MNDDAIGDGIDAASDGAVPQMLEPAAEAISPVSVYVEEQAQSATVAGIAVSAAEIAELHDPGHIGHAVQAIDAGRRAEEGGEFG